MAFPVPKSKKGRVCGPFSLWNSRLRELGTETETGKMISQFASQFGRLFRRSERALTLALKPRSRAFQPKPHKGFSEDPWKRPERLLEGINASAKLTV